MPNIEKQPFLPGSDGEHHMQEHFHTQEKAKEFYDRQMLEHLAVHMQTFIQEQEMVFIATSDSKGECDSSFRSGEAGFIIVIDEKRLLYPDYKGNGVLASAGNISENPHIGMLFVDFFKDKVGLHVNGKASIIDEHEAIHLLEESFKDRSLEFLNPAKDKTVFWVLVHVEEAYIHCSKNIPILKKDGSSKATRQARPVDFFKLQQS